MAEQIDQKRRRTKAEKAEHAKHAKNSSDRKRAAGLDRLNVWVPAEEKSEFKSAADAATKRFLKKTASPETCDICVKTYKLRSGLAKSKKSSRQPDSRQKLLDFG